MCFIMFVIFFKDIFRLHAGGTSVAKYLHYGSLSLDVRNVYTRLTPGRSDRKNQDEPRLPLQHYIGTAKYLIVCAYTRVRTIIRDDLN